MIIRLVPHLDFSPTPRVDVRLVDEAFTWDGGTPGVTGPDSLDGGTPSTTSGGYDAGDPFTRVVDIPEGTDTVTLRSTSEGRTFSVRGGIERAFSRPFGIQDVEPPLRGVPVSYALDCFAAGVSVGTVDLGSVTVPRLGQLYDAVIQPPFEPQLAVHLEEMQANVPSITRNAPLALVTPEDAYVPSVIARGRRAGLTDVELDLAIPDRETARKVWATLGTEDDPQIPVWLIRSTNPLLPGVFFCAVESPVEVSVDLHYGGVQSRLLVRVTEVAPPAPGLVVSPLSYDDIDVSYPDYTTADSAYGSYGERDTDWSLAGAAGG